MQKFDELNNFKSRSIPYEEYFGDMDITKEQKQERISFSEDFEDMMLLFFSLCALPGVTEIEMTNFVVASYSAIVNKHTDIDEYLNDYILLFADSTVKNTVSSSNEWFTSDDRAMFVAENEANTTLNYKDFKNALLRGATKKQWIGIRDKKQRRTHSSVDGKVIDIFEPFTVGDSLMMYPKDTSLDADASEIVNCRCSIKYF